MHSLIKGQHCPTSSLLQPLNVLRVRCVIVIQATSDHVHTQRATATDQGAHTVLRQTKTWQKDANCSGFDSRQKWHSYGTMVITYYEIMI